MTDIDDLGERMRGLTPTMTPPPDLMEALRARARRHQVVRSTTWVVSVAAVMAVVVAVPTYLRRGSSLPASVVAQYVAAGDVQPGRYKGPVPIELLRGTPIWLLAERQAGDARLVVVAYQKDGHPCLGSIDSAPVANMVGTGFDGDCSDTDRIDLRWSYMPFGVEHALGPDAVLYGTVPANVRVVAARVSKGRLTQRYVATIGSPATATERVFLFDSPQGASEPIDAQLTFYDANGRRVGGRHVEADGVVH